MNLENYHERRRRLIAEAPKLRELCRACLQPEIGCYCEHVRRFDPGIRFVILIHPIEHKRRIATGRMSHLCLENSHLFIGENFSERTEVNRILADPEIDPFVLYPGPSSINLSHLSIPDRKRRFEPGRRLTIFVIDGTWATARKTIRSRNLAQLPRISFAQGRESTFRVRKQPAEGCLSTIEAIHQTIELLGPTRDFHTRAHDGLLTVFDSMVERQLRCIQEYKVSRHTLTSRKRALTDYQSVGK